MRIVSWIVGLLALGAVAAWALVAAFVRRMVTWRARGRSVRVTRADQTRVHLEPGDVAESEAVFSILWPGGSAQLGKPHAEPAGVSREVLATTGDIPLGSVVVSSAPGAVPDAGGAFAEVSFRSPAGEVPGWQYGPDAGAWMIHVHGVRSSRLHTLWSVPPATDAGFTSLVIAYRGSPGGAAAGRNAGMGLHEADDVIAAIEFAVRHGAQRIVLSGWSMGASACLLAAELTPHRERIAGLALVAPTISWRHVMRAGARRLGMPLWTSRLTEWAIATPIVARAVGMPLHVDLDILDRLADEARLTVPALVLGSRADANVPFVILQSFAERNPGLVELHEVPAPFHGWEPNADPEAFASVLRRWLTARV